MLRCLRDTESGVRVLLLTAVLLLGVATGSNAIAIVIRISGSGCTDQPQRFAISGLTCTGMNVIWTVSGDWSPVNPIKATDTDITIKWNSPNANAIVTADYAICGAAPAGTAMSPYYI